MSVSEDSRDAVSPRRSGRDTVARMGSRLAWIAIFGLFVFGSACGPSPQGGGGDGGGSGDIDADPTVDPDARSTQMIDSGGIAYPDAEPFGDGGSCTGWECETPVADGCMPGTPDICGNGTDEDCDGEVDEGCTCQSGAVQACFRGPPGRRGVGSCVDGMQTCQGGGEFTYWGPCEGGITPSTDVCDTQDNNCNGCKHPHGVPLSDGRHPIIPVNIMKNTSTTLTSG